MAVFYIAAFIASTAVYGVGMALSEGRYKKGSNDRGNTSLLLAIICLVSIGTLIPAFFNMMLGKTSVLSLLDTLGLIVLCAPCAYHTYTLSCKYWIVGGIQNALIDSYRVIDDEKFGVYAKYCGLAALVLFVIA